jgi:hypothetical protein
MDQMVQLERLKSHLHLLKMAQKGKASRLQKGW